MTSEPSKSTDRPSPSKDSVKSTKSVTTGTPLDARLQARLDQFDAICDGSRDLFEEKNKQYADSIARTGAIGAAVSIAGISARIEHMIIGAADAGASQEKELVELVKDLHNYSNILGIMIMDGNWRPE